MSIGGPEFGILLVMLVVAVVPLVLGILVAVDASKYPDDAFERAGTSKTLWIVLPIVGIFVCFVAFIVAIVWYTSYKHRVAAAAAGGGAAIP